MRKYTFIFPFALASIAFFASCSTLDKASTHGFTNGYYQLNSVEKKELVYADVTDEKIDVYNQSEEIPYKNIYLSIPLKGADSLQKIPLKFSKQSLDIDLTTILLKYRPSVYGLPPQLNTDLNFALYAGWRHDNFKFSNTSDPLGKHYPKITNLGYDFGLFAGPGTTLVSPFSTNNRTNNEYTGMIVQTGIAAFLESNTASFGLAVGLDYLLNKDREIWIYNNKPWVGFIVGVAIN